MSTPPPRRQLTHIYIWLSIILMFSTVLNRRFTISGIDYAIYAILMGAFCIYGFRKKKLTLPRGYIWLFLTFLAVICVNSYISSYTPSLSLTALATFVTCMPFIHYAISYNVDFTEADVSYFINAIIRSITVMAAIMYVESYVLFTAKFSSSLLGSQIFMMGFVSSLCNQGLILAMAQYMKTRHKRYLRYAAFFILTVLLTIQFKALMGAIVVIGAYMLYMSRNRKRTLLIIAAASIVAFGGVMTLPAFRAKLLKYGELYDLSAPNDGIARIALYLTSAQIAIDHFPLGTGQGTFGSIPVNKVYSDVYHDYGIDRVWGLAENSEFDFKMDTHWSSILGETGVLGLVLYVLLMTFTWRRFRRGKDKHIRDRAYEFVVIFSPLCMMFESTTLALPNRLAFIVIYSGLAAVMMRSHNLKRRQLLTSPQSQPSSPTIPDESTSDNN